MAERSEELPEECWEAVFKYLTQPSHWQSVSLACRQFLYISNRLRPSLRISNTSFGISGGLSRILRRFQGLREIDLTNFHGNLARPILDIAHSGLHLHVLSLQGQKGLPLEAIAELGKSCRNLRSLNCSRFHFFQDGDLCAIAEAFPYLEELDICYPHLGFRPPQIFATDFDASLYPGAITDAGIEALVAKLHNLKVVNISGNYFLSDNALAALSLGCIRLKELILFDCPFITDNGLGIIASHCSELTTLAVNGARISSLGIRTFISSTISLQFLDLSLLTLSDELLSHMGELHLPLKRLVLARCKGITSAGIVGIARACPLLAYLNLEGAQCLTDEIMETLAQSLSNLTYICLNYCSLLTDSSFFCLLKNCSHLEELEMESTGLGWGTSGMAPNQQRCKLRSLKIAWNKPVGDVTLRCIGKLCPRLVSLDVSHCLLVTDNGLTAISGGCPDLRELYLKGCRQVMSLGIDVGFKNLEQLQVEGSGFTDTGLVAIGRSCRHLLRLSLEGCLRITESGLRRVMEDCRELRQVNLKNCKCINLDALAWMVFSRPSLRKLVPPSSCVSEGQKALLLRHGCEVFSCSNT
eukprot:Gb_06464 [translate_table: standard]